MMMVQFLFSFVMVLLYCGQAFSQTCPQYTVCQNFEGDSSCSGFLCLSGVDNGETWSVSNPMSGATVNANYSTLVLHGSQSLKMSSVGATCIEFSPCHILLTKDTTLTNFNEIYFFFRIRFDELPLTSGYKPIFGMDDAFNFSFIMNVNDSGNIQICHGETCQISASAISEDTNYFVWGYYGINDGVSDGSAWVKIGTSTTIPTSNFVSVSGNGTGYIPISLHFMVYSDSIDYLLDQVLYRSKPIGSICQ